MSLRAVVGILKVVVVPLSITTKWELSADLQNPNWYWRALCVFLLSGTKHRIFIRGIENADFITIYNLAVWSIGYLLYFFSCWAPDYEEARQVRKEKRKRNGETPTALPIRRPPGQSKQQEELKALSKNLDVF